MISGNGIIAGDGHTLNALDGGVTHSYAKGRGLRPIVRSAAEIEPETLRSIWDGVFWHGKVTMLAGDPGLGKSLVTTDIAARLSRGDAMPCASASMSPMNTLLLTAEDDPADTVVPRLMAAGADRQRVHFLDGFSDDSNIQGFITLDRNIELLAQAVKELSVSFVIIDPISAYLGKTDSHKNADVRALLAPLSQLAMELDFAVCLVSHLNKGSSGNLNAVGRIGGSIAFTAASRAAYLIARDPKDGTRRLMLQVKNNLAPDAAGYSYSIDTTEAGTPRVNWSSQREHRTANEVVDERSPRTVGRDTKMRETAGWLMEQLKNGPRPAREMREAAKERGYSERAINSAKKLAHVQATRDGEAWYWGIGDQQTTSRSGQVIQ